MSDRLSGTTHAALAGVFVLLSVGARAEAQEARSWTPKQAIAAINSSPLVFVARFDGRPIGLFDQVCLFRNKEVLVRVNYCAEASGMSERRGKEASGIEVFRADGQAYSFYAEVRSPGEVFDGKREDYVMFRLSYHDYAAVDPPVKLRANGKQFMAFRKAATDQRERIACFMYKGEPNCHDQQVIGPAIESFFRSPPAQWYSLLGKIETLIDKHGLERKKKR